MSEAASPRLTRLLIEAIAKHLPPSGAEMRLLDVNGEAGPILASMRGDLHITSVPGQSDAWPPDTAQLNADAVVAYSYNLNDDFLQAAMNALRPGGRLIVVNPRGDVTSAQGCTLEAAGYTRILVETAVECPLPTGVLMRGEKPHVTTDTLARVQSVAEKDPNGLDLSDYEGRYVHLLIIQTPNKPVWRLEDGEQVIWQAVALSRNGSPAALLAFSSLPKAVAFMQQAVAGGQIVGVNKIAKFKRETVATWMAPSALNPSVKSLQEQTVTLLTVDPSAAETPDE